MKTYNLLPSSFSNLFDEVLGSEILDRNIVYHQPKANIIENETAYSIELLVPGYEKEDFSLSINENKLNVEGKATIEDKKFKQNEFTIKNFSRSFYLPDNINKEKIEATYEQGILTLIIPKKEEFTKKIEIKIK